MTEQNTALRQDESLEERIEQLLATMTLAEKIGQLNILYGMPDVVLEGYGIRAPTTVAACEEFMAGTYYEKVGPGSGLFGATSGFAPFFGKEGLTPTETAEFLNKMQEVARDKSRLGIPLLNMAEGYHAVMTPGATIFPEGPTLGSTWNLDLIRDVYAAEAREARALGIHLLTVSNEPIRDPRLGRNCGCYAECIYLTSRIVESLVEGAQGNDVSQPDKVVLMLCHYPGQSDPVSGLEQGAIEYSERRVREVFLPPFETGIRNKGALGVMATYPTIDGVPAHGSKLWLDTVLRGELAFEGVVFSEGFGFLTLTDAGVAKDQKDAGRIAIHAGVDVNISTEPAYLDALAELVEEGAVAEEIVDRAVRRVLGLKFRLGLFDRSPLVDVAAAAQVVNSPQSRATALNAAREGIVLLKNEGLLPLAKTIKTVAVIGPNADAPVNQCGDYIPALLPNTVVTVLGGIKAKLGDAAEVSYARGCGVMGDSTDGFAEAVAAAQGADVAIIVVGEQQGEILAGASDDLRDLEPDQQATIGERFDSALLELTGQQEQLIKAIEETGTPVVVVLINGRPLAIPKVAKTVPAIVEAWLPGELGGEAIADILFGDINPSGRLPVTFPRHVGQLPVYYDYKYSKRQPITFGVSYTDLPITPLYEFGYGLSYTSFEYDDLAIDASHVEESGTVTVSFLVSNVGGVAGMDVPQVYIRDVHASIVQPVRRLAGFTKLELEPGASRRVEFELGYTELSMINFENRRVVEPGLFEVMVGASCDDIRINGEFQLEKEITQ